MKGKRFTQRRRAEHLSLELQRAFSEYERCHPLSAPVKKERPAYQAPMRPRQAGGGVSKK